MTEKTLKIADKLLLGLCFVVLLFCGPAFAQDFELSYDDPEGDVEDWDGQIYEYGYEYIDILEVSSSENILGTQLILEMTVSGIITDSEDIVYTFYLMDGEEWIYIVSYCNGMCTGMDMNDFEEDVLQASGSGTSTLEIRVSTSYLGDISEFDFWSMTSEYDGEIDLEDYAPDSGPGWGDYDFDYYEVPLFITDPKDGATVSGTETITGYTDLYYEMVSVEIQFDSESSGGWILTSTNDEWETWSYEWQTTSLADGEHTIYARGYDGAEYYFDEITVFVDQSNAVSPRTTDVPTLSTGYEYRYEVDFSGLYSDFLYEDMDITVDAEMTMTVKKKESIDVEGSTYEAYAIDVSMIMSQSMAFEGESMSYSITEEGTEWLRVSDLATIKSDITMVISSSYMGMSQESMTQSATITYDPPMDSYNFPISIAETWSATCLTTIETTSTYFGEPETYEESYEATTSYEALHVEDITTSVGTFETFVIWSEDISEGYYGGAETMFFGSGSGYTLTYYSVDHGLPVKIESYGLNRELQISMELASIKEAGQERDLNAGPFGWEFPIYLLFIFILVAIILSSIMVVKRKRKKAAAEESWQQYAIGPEVPGQAPQSTESISGAYYTQTGQLYPISVPTSQATYIQTKPVYSTQSTAQKPSLGGQPQDWYAQQPSSPQIPPPPPSIAQQQGVIAPKQSQPQAPPLPSQVQQPDILPPQPSIKTRAPIYKQPVKPIRQIRCPNCSNVLSIQEGTLKVQCPICGTQGRVG